MKGRYVNGANAAMNASRERGQRMSVLDVLVVASAFVCAFSTLSYNAASPPQEVDGVLTPAELLEQVAGALDFLIAAVALGMTYSGPLVLSAHVLLLGRREPLSIGEWFWLSPLMTCLAFVAVGFALSKSISQDIAAIWSVLCLLTQEFLGGVALIVLITSGGLDNTGSPRRWTDTFGLASCTLVSLLMAYIVYSGMGMP